MSTPNPYQQSPYPNVPPQQPNPYAQPQPPYGQVPPAPFGAPAGGPGGPGGRRRVPGWVWALGGVVVASAVWAGALFATGTLGSGGEADFAGHQYQENLCESTPLKAFGKRYTVEESDSDNRFASQQKAIDQSYCGRSLEDPKAGENSLSSVFVSTSAEWHKVTDPAGEFASLQLANEDRTDKTYTYEAEPLKGYGDEAYVVTERRGSDKPALGAMTLAVRDGWFTFEMRWSWFGGGPDDKAAPPAEHEIRAMLEADARATLDALKG
ncbi:hypothetical protein [Streptomyces ficellus]|uniref:DUF3558 domain-containing protein n=1 Tax=Streptomyces ficellus TaxID=1977088 RepID=A0A6I6F4T2_9ACTN|nr:hypothetical protein [Streptomyces ficellus]QGV78630.1 hypothetical protein EIZ62_10530 [Streptomyces ficellus]